MKSVKKSKSLKRNALILLGVFTITFGLCAAGIFYAADASLGDRLYQSNEALDGTVALITIDSRALNEYGNLPWSRDIYADIIEALNADPEAKPAAIGIDVVFAGHSQSPEADNRLVEACKAGGNVVVAGDAIFGNSIITKEDGFYLSTDVQSWDGPFDELKAVTEVGHINASYDNDGTIRHFRRRVTTKEGEEYQIFGRALYEVYCKNIGLEQAAEPDSDNIWTYLKFSGYPEDFSDNISVADILSGDVPGDYFQDCIVIIGPYDATLQDNYKTAISHDKNMFGVEIQANIAQAYINGQWPQSISKDRMNGLLLVLGLMMVVLMAGFGLKATIACWVVLTPIWLLLCKLLANRGCLLNPMYVPVLATVMAVTAIALHYITAALEKRRVTKVFSRYVAPGVVKELLKEDESALGLGGKNVDIAVLFVDIRGFTTMSEAMEPEQVVAILNDYLQLTTDCVMSNQGTLDKFVGDCTMAFWNAPLPQEDYVYKACKAAMDMVEGSIALTDELEKKFGRRVGFGIGVHCGPAVVGNIGAKERMDFTAIGDTVNTSSRLESNAPASTIYISRVVADILGDRAETTSLGGTVKLKGKAEGFEVLTLDKLK